MSETLEQIVIRELPWLQTEHKFQVLESGYDPEVFGDSYVVLENSRLRLKFLRDRGDILLTVSPVTNPDRSWHLEDLVELAEGKPAEYFFELKPKADTLKKYYVALLELLGPRLDETTVRLEEKFRKRLEDGQRGRMY